MLEQIIAQFFTDDAGAASSVAAADAQRKALLKCVLGDDIRVVEVFVDQLLFEDLVRGLAQKYGVKPELLVLRYHDSDGDLVHIGALPFCALVLLILLLSSSQPSPRAQIVMERCRKRCSSTLRRMRRRCAFS